MSERWKAPGEFQNLFVTLGDKTDTAEGHTLTFALDERCLEIANKINKALGEKKC